jgi:hypothetical protein
MDKMQSAVLLSYVFDGGRSVIRSIAIWLNGLVFFGGSIRFKAGFEGC